MTSIATTVIVVGVLFGDRRLARPRRPAPPARPAASWRRPCATTPAYVYTGLAIVVCIYFLSAPTQNLRSFLTTLVDRRPRRLRHPRAAQAGRRGIPRRRATATSSAAPRTASSARSRAPTWASEPSKLRLPEMRRPSGEARRRRPTRAGRRRGRPPRAASSASPTLHEKGVLTDEEFAAEKARVLGGERAPERCEEPASGLEPETSSLTRASALPIELGGQG